MPSAVRPRPRGRARLAVAPIPARTIRAAPAGARGRRPAQRRSRPPARRLLGRLAGHHARGRRSSVGSWPGVSCVRCARSPTTARTISAGNLTSASRSPARTTSSSVSATRSTICWPAGGLLRGPAAVRGQRLARAAHAAHVERTLLQVALADPNATEETLRATCEELLASQQRARAAARGAAHAWPAASVGSSGASRFDLAAVTERVVERRASRARAPRRSQLDTTLDPAPADGDPALARAADREPDRQRRRPQRPWRPRGDPHR